MRGWGVKEGGGDLSARYYREFSLCKRRFSVWVLIWNNLGAAEIFLSKNYEKFLRSL